MDSLIEISEMIFKKERHCAQAVSIIVGKMVFILILYF